MDGCVTVPLATNVIQGLRLNTLPSTIFSCLTGGQWR